MSDLDFDDLELHPDDEDENYVRLRKDDVTALRKAARNRGAAEKELAEYKRRDKVRAAGLEGLSERQINALAREAGDDDSPETLHTLAVEFGWATKPEKTDEEQRRETEIEQQTQAAQVANGATAPQQRTQVKAEDVAGWPVDKQMRLNENHPHLMDLALAGEPIDLPPGFN